MARSDSTARTWTRDYRGSVAPASVLAPQLAPEPAAALVPRPVLAPGRRPALPPSPRPAPEAERWRPLRLSPGFAVGWALSLVALGLFTAIWLVGMVATTVFLILGQGTLGPVLIFGVTGVLLSRGWAGMVQTIRGRLRTPDLTDLTALPDAFWALSPELRRLVRHARSLRVALDDPDLGAPQIDREMFEWIASMARLPAPDRDWLAERGIDSDGLRVELVNSRWSADRAPRWADRRPGWQRPDHLSRAVAMLERFEQRVLSRGGDPFRG